MREDTTNAQVGEEKPSKLMSALGLILCIVFGAMLLCNLTIIIKGTLYPEKPPSVLGITPMVVLSGSMSGNAPDHIEIGDLIFVDKIEAQALEAGDVIAFMEGKVVVTHRILEVFTGDDGKLQYVTKGDANNAADLEPVHEDDLVGIYKFRIPKVGDFALFLQTPLGMVLFIGVPMLAFILYDLIRRRHYAKLENERTAELQAELEQAKKEKDRTAELEAELERLRALAGEKAASSETKK